MIGTQHASEFAFMDFGGFLAAPYPFSEPDVHGDLDLHYTEKMRWPDVDKVSMNVRQLVDRIYSAVSDGADEPRHVRHDPVGNCVVLEMEIQTSDYDTPKCTERVEVLRAPIEGSGHLVAVPAEGLEEYVSAAMHNWNVQMLGVAATHIEHRLPGFVGEWAAWWDDNGSDHRHAYAHGMDNQQWIDAYGPEIIRPLADFCGWYPRTGPIIEMLPHYRMVSTSSYVHPDNSGTQDTKMGIVRDGPSAKFYLGVSFGCRQVDNYSKWQNIQQLDAVFTLIR